MNAFVLMSHGDFATGLAESVEMIAGENEHLYTVCLYPSEGKEELKVKIHNLMENLNGYDQITVFCDLLGGTPCNSALEVFFNNEKVLLISGMNFSMVLHSILSSEQNVAEILEVGRNGISQINLMLNTDEEEEDE